MHPSTTAAIARVPLTFTTPHRWTPSDRVFMRMSPVTRGQCAKVWRDIGIRLATVIKRDASFLIDVPAGVVCMLPVQHVHEIAKYNEIVTVLRDAGRSQRLFAKGTQFLWEVFVPSEQNDCGVTLTAMELLDWQDQEGPFTDKLARVGT